MLLAASGSVAHRIHANDFALVARKNGLTPFSVYQGRWNAAFRDMESEIIPMCEDQGMGIVSWASLGGGQLTTTEQRRKMEEDPNAPKGYGLNEFDVPVSEVIEKLAETKKATFQQVVSPAAPSMAGAPVADYSCADGIPCDLPRHYRIFFTNLPTFFPSWEYKRSSMWKQFLAR